MPIRPPSATRTVLALLCLMYFVTYVDRVNVSTAAGTLQQEFGLSNTQLGFVFSAFAYPYLVFQIIGGWLGDRFGARRTLLLCGLIWASATVLTGFAQGFLTLVLARVMLGFGEGATFPAATRAMSNWTSPSSRGFAQGLTHSCARIGNAITPPLVAWLIIALSWRGSFVVLGVASFAWVLVWGLYFRDNPRDHPGITQNELDRLPPHVDGSSAAQIPWGAVAPHVARHAGLLLLRMDAVAVSEPDPVVLFAQPSLGSQALRAVRVWCVLRWRRGGHSGWIDQ
jgi:sugar phosphate permease